MKMGHNIANTLPENDSTMVVYRQFLDKYGEDGRAVFIGMCDEHLFDLDHFQDYYDLNENIRAINGVSECLSVTRVFNLVKNDSVKKFNLVQVVNRRPETQAEVDSIREVIESLAMYDGLLFNSEKHSTMMLVTLDGAHANKSARKFVVADMTAILNAYGDAHGIEMCKAEQLHREGKLPKRVCHCDTKVNNMMFDDKGNVLCVIDLDTLMPSYVFSDFGDFLRTAANPVAEDSPEVEKVDFDMEIFKAFSRGYIRGTKSFLTPIEKENLPYAACLFPFMQAVRFFADYINGDTYYKTKYPEHNLVRTRNQMALFRSAMAKVPQMKAWLDSL